MQFNYSEPVQHPYDPRGLAEGISLRIHKDKHLEVKGARRAQQDWSKYVCKIEGYHGGLGDYITFISATVPECLPSRLETISYANEFAFLYDDKMESFDLKKDLATEASKMLDAFGDGALDRRVTARSGPEKRLQVKMLSEMMALDPVRAETSMKAWARFVQLASRTRSSPFETLEKYIPARVIDAGELIWFGTLTFGMALTIPDDEYDMCMAMARPGYAALGLTNDLFSWEKERHDSEKAGLDYVFNAIWVIMKEQSVTEAEAKDICRREIKKHVSTFKQTIQETKHSPCLSKDLKTYLEAVLYSISGNLVWSACCPRYREF
ncbi:putative fusicoccadiene synthase [Rosellinia necatrix]|uniref:Putative fusicoccadiene synthase n=1 Tax=Rosellinia necatrix TaxID=77044 RepID=A0A1W2TSD1_ROSNE|nr:putative fusicoccadiene synthase [Rosellinia necatrix]